MDQPELGVIVPTTILFAITTILHVLFGIYFFVARSTFPLRARSPGLMTVLWLSMTAQLIRTYIAAFEGTLSCIYEVWISTLTFIHVVTLIVRSIRLLLIFNLAKYTLRELEDEDGVKKIYKRKSFWSNPKLVSETYMLVLLLFLCLVVLLEPTIINLLSSLSPPDSAETVCFYSLRIGASIVYGIAALGLVIVAIKVRKVHDAFFLKNEFKWLAAIGIPIAVVSMIANSVEGLEQWGPIANIAFFLTNTITSFVIPSMISIKKRKRFFSFSSGSKTSLTSSGVDSTQTSITEDVEKPSKPIDLLRDKEAMVFIEEFLAHYQLVKQSRNLLCYFDLLKYKLIDNELARTSKAYLLFQKYMEKNSYIQVDMITEEEQDFLREKISQALTKFSDDENIANEDIEPLSPELFDGIVEKLRRELKRRVIKPFMASEFYPKYLASVRLNKGLQEVESF